MPAPYACVLVSLGGGCVVENPNYWVEKLISKKKTRKFVLESMKDDLNVIDEKVGVVSK